MAVDAINVHLGRDIMIIIADNLPTKWSPVHL